MANTLLSWLKGILVQDETDRSKELAIEIDPASTTGTRTTLKAAQTADRDVTLPDATDTLVGETATQTIENKTIDATSATGNNTITLDASAVTFDNAASGLTAVDVQAAVDEVEGRVDTNETDIGNIQSGKADNDLSNLSSVAINTILQFGAATAGEVSTADNGAGDSEDLTIKTGTATGTRGTILLQDGSEGTIGHVWTSTGVNGEGEWQVAAGGGGDAWSDPVDSNLTPDTTNAYNLGSSSATFADIHLGGNINVRTTINLENSSGTDFGNIRGNQGTSPSGQSASNGLRINSVQTANASPIIMYSASSSSANANATGNVNIETGNKTAGTGNSGNINLIVGTSSGGSRGTINIQDGSEGTIGHVWTSTGVNGEGNWAAASGGGANTNLSNLSSPTSVNENLIPSGVSKTIGDSTNPWGDIVTQLVTIKQGSTTFATIQETSSDVYLDTAQGADLNLRAPAGAGTSDIYINSDGFTQIDTGSSQDIKLNAGNRVDASSAGGPFRAPNLSSDPGSPLDGDIWYNTTSNQLKARVNGSTVVLA